MNGLGRIGGGLALLVGAIITTVFLVRSGGVNRVIAAGSVSGLLTAVASGIVANEVLADSASGSRLHPGGSRTRPRPSIVALIAFATVALSWLRPLTTLADAVGTGSEPVNDSQGLLGNLLGFVPAIVAVTLALGVLVILGRLIARIGRVPAGREHHAAEAVGAEPVSAGSQTRTILAGIVLGVPAIGAFLAGRAAAAQSHEGGLSGIFAMVDLAVGGGAVVIALLIVGLTAFAFRGRRGSGAITTVFLAAGVIVVGAFAGTVTAPLTGGLPRPPIVLRADARVHVDLDRPPLSFAPSYDGVAECRSEPDTRTVSDLSGLDLGELGPGTVRVGVAFGAGNDTSIQLFIDGGDLPDGSPTVTWTGPGTASATRGDFSSGQVAFTRLPLSFGRGKPAESAPAKAGVAWPATLSGTLTWTCGTWAARGPANDETATSPAAVRSGTPIPTAVEAASLFPDQRERGETRPVHD